MGAVWTLESFEPGTNVVGLAFVNGVFIAVGDSGLISTSSDGVDWAGNRRREIWACRGWLPFSSGAIKPGGQFLRQGGQSPGRLLPPRGERTE